MLVFTIFTLCFVTVSPGLSVRRLQIEQNFLAGFNKVLQRLRTAHIAVPFAFFIHDFRQLFSSKVPQNAFFAEGIAAVVTANQITTLRTPPEGETTSARHLGINGIVFV